MRRKRKPTKAVTRRDSDRARPTADGHRAFETKGRTKAHLSRYINEESQ